METDAIPLCYIESFFCKIRSLIACRIRAHENFTAIALFLFNVEKYFPQRSLVKDLDARLKPMTI